MDATPIEIAFGALQGLLVSTGFLLTLFIGFLVIAGLTKHGKREKNSSIVRNVSERMGRQAQYLPPDAPRGRADQLQTPELSEQSSQES
tara:strand:+ start:3603 stop:3869 length:267 start_codon:yes stop_codon:yes gene_type:complete